MLKKLLVTLSSLAFSLALTAPAHADIVQKPIVYTIDEQPYEGYYAINEGLGTDQPVVLLIHDWDGIGEYEKRRVQMLAEQGYAAFAIDLYGQGIRPETTEESQAESNKLYSDRATMRQRLFAGLQEVQNLPGIDGSRVVAIGYCFGGASVLELARSGADIDGFVSFHGGLETPENQNYEQVQAPILILHGSDDPVAPMEQVATLAQAMNEANVDYQMELYGGVRHSFTVWGASGESSQYDASADLASWDALLGFLDTQLD
ncbi:MAG: prolyl oligopeptidase family serine peptidase [Cyanobacteria bacterium]|jgi:dienelactone hydrolase|nr:prolyl oligopeptidase family serine peptidase [Cyanobacteria bacterium GSL.Bin21]